MREGAGGSAWARLPGALGAGLLDFAGRLARHWFLIILLYGSVCLFIWGYLGLDYGIPFLFREDQDLPGFTLANLLQSSSFYTQMFATLLAGAVWVFAVHLDGSANGRRLEEVPFGPLLWSLNIRVFVIASLPLLALRYPYSPALPELGLEEFHRALLGWLAGTFLNASILAAAWLLERFLEPLAQTAQRRVEGLLAAYNGMARPSPLRRLIHQRNFVPRVVILWIMFVVAWTAITQGLVVDVAAYVPAVAIFGIVGMLLAGYVFLNFFHEHARLWVLLVLIVLPIVNGGREPYRYTFPGLESYYRACDNLLAAIAAGRRPPPAVAEGCAGRDGAATTRVRRQDPLKGLASLQLPPSPEGAPRKPKLVVASISGGAYRAAFWGALVLDRLRRESAPGGRLVGFAQSIRLFTGASGGMVPAAYFATLPFEEEVLGDDPSRSIEAMLAADIGGDGPEPRLDSLSPVAKRIVQGELLHPLLPWRYEEDRGRVLEDQWRRLQVTFESLRAEEARGRRPSLILSPMIAETGQPLLISNLDLTGVSGDYAGQTIDLFRELPAAPRTLTLATAVRMSATFPYVSPAVNLPTVPPLRVLDAGFFDNYGMSIAIAYLRQPDVLRWLAENTSGVVLLQIDAYPLKGEAGGEEEAACRPPAGEAIDSWLVRALQPITTPVAGLFSAREKSMLFRNEIEIATLQQALRAATAGRPEGPLQLDRVVFDNAARASFSWYLPRHDLECLRRQLDSPANRAALAQLEAIWNGTAP